MANSTLWGALKRGVSIAIGAGVATLGLQAFLIPNHLTDGGIVGVSIIAAHLARLPIGIFLLCVNAPFIYLGYKKLGRMFAISSIAGITLMSLLTGLLHSNAAVTADPVLAAVFGGLAIGVGSGIVIRYGGTLDGTEIIAILAEKKSPFSVGELIMAMNLLILGSAGFVFGWDKAMYSLIAYVVAYKAMDITAEGLDQSKSVWIVSDEYLRIGEAIQRELGRKVTYVNGRSADGLVSSGVILSVITRIEEQKLKSAVSACDPRAFVVISDVHEVMSHHFQGRA